MLKKIESRKEADKKKKKNQIIIGAILIGLMIVSTAGYAFMNDKAETNKPASFNGINFYRSGEVWTFNLQGTNFYFKYLPNETSNVTLSGAQDLGQYAGKPLYFVNGTLGEQEIINNIGQYVMRYQEACLANCSEFPLKTCADNLIVFRDASESRVWKDGNCTYISGNAILGADALLYRFLGIN